MKSPTISLNSYYDKVNNTGPQLVLVTAHLATCLPSSPGNPAHAPLPHHPSFSSLLIATSAAWSFQFSLKSLPRTDHHSTISFHSAFCVIAQMGEYIFKINAAAIGHENRPDFQTVLFKISIRVQVPGQQPGRGQISHS